MKRESKEYDQGKPFNTQMVLVYRLEGKTYQVFPKQANGTKRP